MPFKKIKHLVFSRYLSLLCLLLFLVVASVFVAVSLGAVTIDIGDTYGVILRKLGFPIASHNIAKPLEAIIWNMRVPRVLRASSWCRPFHVWECHAVNRQ